VRWFSYADTYSYACRYTDAYSSSNADTFAYADSNAHTYSYSNPDACGDAYSCGNSDPHACRHANTGPNTYSVARAQLHHLDQSSLGESSAHRRNCHLYRDDHAHGWFQFAGCLYRERTSGRSYSGLYSQSGFGQYLDAEDNGKRLHPFRNLSFHGDRHRWDADFDADCDRHIG